MPSTPHLQDIQVSAMLLAAGRGSRMRPLTDHCPKPLLALRGKPLMQWTLEALARDGVGSAVVNTGWLGEQIPARFGDGVGLGLDIAYSHETRDFGDALETAGGIARALPLLGDIFWLVAGDVYAPDFVFSPASVARFAAGDALAHLWLVPNPAQHPRGDFHLRDDGIATSPAPDDTDTLRLTYSTIGLYRAALFTAPWCDIPAGNPYGRAAPLAPLLRAAMAQGRITAERHDGRWADVGTPERLAQLQDSHHE